jgi:hypothetical protein
VTSAIRADFSVLVNIAAWNFERLAFRDAPMTLFLAGVPVAEIKTLMETYAAETIEANTLYSSCTSNAVFAKARRVLADQKIPMNRE